MLPRSREHNSGTRAFVVIYFGMNTVNRTFDVGYRQHQPDACHSFEFDENAREDKCVR